jgi:hypothetical protein
VEKSIPIVGATLIFFKKQAKVKGCPTGKNWPSLVTLTHLTEVLKMPLRNFCRGQGDRMSLLINGPKCIPPHFLSKINTYVTFPVVKIA